MKTKETKQAKKQDYNWQQNDLNTNQKLHHTFDTPLVPSSDAIIQQKTIEGLGDSKEEGIAQVQQMLEHSLQIRQTVQLQSIFRNNDLTNTVVQKKGNNKGLPDNLKSRIESLSGYSMDDVKVHYNSNKPAQLNARAYAQGTNIHIASGQEKHLPHEAWHVVQQKQGRVKPTIQANNGKVGINDDPKLEKEADDFGAIAHNIKPTTQMKAARQASPHSGLIQMKKSDYYRGGAELELDKPLMTLNFDKADKQLDVKEMILALKGLEIDTFKGDLFRGNEWALTVETTSHGFSRDESKINMEPRVELILGGRKGSLLSDLPKISKEAAEQMKKLSSKGLFTFENFSQRLKYNYEKNMKNWDIKPKDIDWKSLEMTAEWKTPIDENKKWQVQITLGVALEDMEKATQVIDEKFGGEVGKKSMDLTIKADQVNAGDILKKLEDNGVFTSKAKGLKPDFSKAYEKASEEAEIKYPTSKKGYAFSREKYTQPRANELLKKESDNFEAKRYDAFEESGYRAMDKNSSDIPVPSQAALRGLARVISAYIRGISNKPGDGPKHPMILATKNPFHHIVASACQNSMHAFDVLLKASADLVLEKTYGKKYSWTNQKGGSDIELPIKEWYNVLLNKNIDLVSVYDKKHRFGQVGGLKELNYAGPDPGVKVKSIEDFGAVPVIEYRRAGNLSPKMMPKYFIELINALG